MTPKEVAMLTILIAASVGLLAGMAIGYFIGVESGLNQAFGEIQNLRLKPDDGELSPADRRKKVNRPWV